MLATLFLLAQIAITPSSNDVKLQGSTPIPQNGTAAIVAAPGSVAAFTAIGADGGWGAYFIGFGADGGGYGALAPTGYIDGVVAIGGNMVVGGLPQGGDGLDVYGGNAPNGGVGGFGGDAIFGVGGTSPDGHYAAAGGVFIAGAVPADAGTDWGNYGFSSNGTGSFAGLVGVGGPHGGPGGLFLGGCDNLQLGSCPDDTTFAGNGIEAIGFGGTGNYSVYAHGFAGVGYDGNVGGVLAFGSEAGGVGVESHGGTDGGTGVIAYGGAYKGYGEVIQAANPVNAELQLVPTAAPTVKTIPGDIYMDSTEKSLAYSGGAQGYRFIPRCFPVLFSASGTATATVETGSSLCIATDSVHSYSVSCGISGTTLTLTASVPNSDPWAVCYW